MALAQDIIATTQEIFSTMIMLDVTPGEPCSRPEGPFKNSVSGMVGMAGQVKGLLAIHLNEDVAKTVTGNFLGMEVEEVDEDVRDAIGELANMLAGNIKMALTEKGNDIKLSIPSAISGEEYTIDSMTDAEITVVPFSLESGEFMVEFQVEGA